MLEHPNGKSAGDSTPPCPFCGARESVKLLAAPDRFHARTRVYQILACPSCSIAWLEDPPAPSELEEHYGADYDRAIAAGGSDPGHWKERRETVLRYKNRGKILDLGCGSGGFLASLRSPSWQLFGIEMSERAAEMAETNTGAEVFVGDILDAPFPEGSFDVVTCFHVIEHLHQPWAVFAQVYKWLKQGGIFYLMTPNIDSAGAKIFGSYWYALELPRHLYHFSPTALGNLARAAGLTEISLTTHRELFVEPSIRYIVDNAFRKSGVQRVPLAQAKPPGYAWRAARKCFRVTILPLIAKSAGLAGDGESIHAVLAKGNIPAAGMLRS